jgi:hypothetical protein
MGRVNTHVRTALVGVAMGLLLCVVLFAFASFSGRGEVGVAAGFLFSLGGGWVLARRYPAGVWYVGAMISLPPWFLFRFVAEPGQFEAYLWGLVAILAGAYAGSFIGAWQRRKVTASPR